MKLFKTISAARQWCIDNPPSGNYRATHIELKPALYPLQTVFMVPGMVLKGSARETACFEDIAGASTFDLGEGLCTIDNILVWGNNNPGSYTFFGNNTISTYVKADLLSAFPPGGGPVEQGLRRSKGYFMQGNFKNNFFDGIWDFDHGGSISPNILRGEGQETDFHHGFRERFFCDAFHMQNGAIFDFNRVRGVVFWNATVRGNRPGGGIADGFNVTPLKLTNLMPDGVTLAPGESFVIFEGGNYFGAALEIGERCAIIINAGAEWPGLSANSRGIARVTKPDGAIVTRPGPARFAWRNAGITAFIKTTDLETQAGRLTMHANGRAGPSALLQFCEDTASVVPAGSRQILCGLELANPVSRDGHRVGIYLRQNSLDNRYVFFGTRDGKRFVIERGTSATNIDGAALVDLQTSAREFRLRIVESGGNRFYDVSVGNNFWSPVYVEPANTYLTFDRCGIALDGECLGAGPIVSAGVTIDDWLVAPW